MDLRLLSDFLSDFLAVDFAMDFGVGFFVGFFCGGFSDFEKSKNPPRGGFSDFSVSDFRFLKICCIIRNFGF